MEMFSVAERSGQLLAHGELDLAVCLSKQRTCAHREALEILSTDGSRVSLSDDKTKQAESRKRRRSVNTMQRARIPSDLFPDSS